MAAEKFVVTETSAYGELEVSHYLARSRGELVRHLAYHNLNAICIMQHVIDITLAAEDEIKSDFPLHPKTIFDLSKLVKGDLSEFQYASDYADEKFPTIDVIMSYLSEDEIEALFDYFHTAGEGYQAKDPGREWHSIHIEDYEEPVFVDISKKDAPAPAPKAVAE